jgi:hypothetical protein
MSTTTTDTGHSSKTPEAQHAERKAEATASVFLVCFSTASGFSFCSLKKEKKTCSEREKGMATLPTLVGLCMCVCVCVCVCIPQPIVGPVFRLGCRLKIDELLNGGALLFIGIQVSSLRFVLSALLFSFAFLACLVYLACAMSCPFVLFKGSSSPPVSSNNTVQRTVAEHHCAQLQGIKHSASGSKERTIDLDRAEWAFC